MENLYFALRLLVAMFASLLFIYIAAKVACIAKKQVDNDFPTKKDH